MITVPTEKPKKSNEWYTPAKYIEAVREVMGSIDLDPASCALANETVKAARYYDEAMNGLEQQWHGRVWLNPPYGNAVSNTHGIGAMRAWTGKLIAEHKAGNVNQAVLCCTLENGARWFNWLWDYIVCFPDHKVRFKALNPSDKWDGKYSHFHGTIFVYLGPNEQSFINVFSQFGTVARRVTSQS